MNTPKIRVFCICEKKQIHKAIKDYLKTETDFKYLGSAETGTEGIKQVQRLTPNVVLVDINLGDMPSLQLIKYLVKTEHNLVCIAMMMSGDADIMRQCILAGARDILSIPIMWKEHLLDSLRGAWEIKWREMNNKRGD